MIKINIVCIGTIKESFYKDAINEYMKRLSRFAKVSIVECNECKIQSATPEDVLKIEGTNMLKKIKQGEYISLIDLHGKEFDSLEFSNYLNDLIKKGVSPINFVIGGTLGLSNDLRKVANEKICLSQLTFTHQMTRVILLEQIYRSFKIINNESYHH